MYIYKEPFDSNQTHIYPYSTSTKIYCSRENLSRKKSLCLRLRFTHRRPVHKLLRVTGVKEKKTTMHLLTTLVPIPDFELGFTTCIHIQHPKIQLLKLDDRQLRVHKVSSRTTHKVVQPPNSNLGGLPSSETAWEAFYPEGSINPSADIPGGFSFYLSGPKEFSERLETASEVVMSYRMMLQKGWEWKKGGKLPGICNYL